MKFDLRETAKDHVIVVAHRGVAGGNIPCNTIAAYEIALSHGADMIETAISKSADGTLFIFHPRAENPHLNQKISIPQMTDAEIRQLRYVNTDHAPTQFGLATFDELLETFKGRCYINIDKFFDHPAEICRILKRHNMSDQILVKSDPSEHVFQVLEELAPDLAYIPFIHHKMEIHGELKRRNINYIGAEVLFTSDDAPVASEGFRDMMHKEGMLLWGNAIVYDYKDQLSNYHSDDTSLTGDPDNGWGWLARHGFDFIQTDWTLAMIQYLKANNLYYRNK